MLLHALHSLFSTHRPGECSCLNQAIGIRQKEAIFKLILELGQQPLWKMLPL